MSALTHYACRLRMREPTRTYRIAMAVNLPVARWARLEVSGVGTLPASGPLLLVGNHDSHWDPVMIGHAARKRRMVRALAKSTLWDVKGLHWVLDGMGQIPIVRGAGDAQALSNAVAALREGSCIGVFPEGTRSRRAMRARSGVGRLALEVPEAHVSCVAVSGTADLTGFPRRPRVQVRFFDPAGGQPRPDEGPRRLSARLLAEIRAMVPPCSPTASAASPAHLLNRLCRCHHPRRGARSSIQGRRGTAKGTRPSRRRPGRAVAAAEMAGSVGSRRGSPAGSRGRDGRKA